MTLPPIDWPALTQAEIDQLITALNTEVTRRHTVANAEQTLDEIGNATLAGEGMVPGGPWRQPVTIGYPKDWPVTHGGDEWKSLIPNNVWEPGNPSDPQSYRWWQNLSDIPATGVWNGNDHPYAVGDEVTFESKRYRCRQAHRSQPGWTPTVVPALWEPIP